MTGLGSKILDASKREYQGQLAKTFANLEVLLNNPVGIGEHTDIVGEVQTCIEKIHDLEGCIQGLFRPPKTPSIKGGEYIMYKFQKF